MRVNLDFIPTLSTSMIPVTPLSEMLSWEDGLRKLRGDLDVVLTKLNELIRNLTVAVNSVEFIGSAGTVENMYCSPVNVTFGAAGTELTAAHSLGRVPIGIVSTKFAGSGGNIGFSSPATSLSAFFKSTTDNLSGSIILI